jgi:hypothetical protein
LSCVHINTESHNINALCEAHLFVACLQDCSGMQRVGRRIGLPRPQGRISVLRCVIVWRHVILVALLTVIICSAWQISLNLPPARQARAFVGSEKQSKEEHAMVRQPTADGQRHPSAVDHLRTLLTAEVSSAEDWGATTPPIGQQCLDANQHLVGGTTANEKPDGATSNSLHNVRCHWYPAPGRHLQCCCEGSFQDSKLPSANRQTNVTHLGLRCLPSFIIVGAQKSGTTALFAQLLNHTAVSVLAPRRKEIHYFDSSLKLGLQYYLYHLVDSLQAVNTWVEPPTNRDSNPFPSWTVSELQSFASATGNTFRIMRFVATHLTGETTPSYVLGRDTMRHIRNMLPTARLIFLMRNPVDRTYSE